MYYFQRSLVLAYGRGDYATAIRLLGPLANRGNASAEAMLGTIYALGQGVLWRRRQNNLGFMYAQGQGVASDYKAALSWYRKAADHGYAAAEYNLGLMYHRGLGVPQDFAEALAWYRGNRNALQNRDAVARLMTPAQIERRRSWRASGNRNQIRVCTQIND